VNINSVNQKPQITSASARSHQAALEPNSKRSASPTKMDSVKFSSELSGEKAGSADFAALTNATLDWGVQDPANTGG
jgi:hypothetical protein